MTNEEEDAVVDTVTKMRRSGASYREIAAALSAEGLTTRTGGSWNPITCDGLHFASGSPEVPNGYAIADPTQDTAVGIRLRSSDQT